MRSALQLLGGVAVAGVVAAGSTALTGSGVTWGGSNGATASRVIGGTLVQAVTGVSVTHVVYLTDGTGTHTTSIAVTVAGATGKTLTVTPSGGTLTTGVGGLPVGWTCSDGTVATYHATAPATAITTDPATVTCIPTLANSTVAGYYDGITGLSLAVTPV